MPLELPNNFVRRLQNGIIHVYTKPNLRLQDAQLFNRYHISFSNHHTMNLLNRFSFIFLTASTICYCGAVQPNPTKNPNHRLVSYLTETSTVDDINNHHLVQDRPVVLDDLAFVIEQPFNREEVWSAMQQFHADTQVGVAITTVYQDDPYAILTRQSQADWLKRALGISLFITLDEDKAYQQCVMQVTPAVELLLPSEDREQIQKELMEHYFFSDLTPDDACAQGLLVGIAAMKERILRDQIGDGGVDKQGVSQGGGNGKETQETVTPESATYSTQLYITYGKQKYQDKDVIFFPFDTKKKVNLKAVVENDTTQNKNFTWKGVTSSKNDKGTVDLSKSTGKSANKVELTYGGKTIELSVNVVGAYFERLPDGTSGQKNIYGYDEMDKVNPDDDHVSVETNGETFVELKTSTKNFKGIFLKPNNPLAAEAVFDGKKVKIIGKGQNKKQTLINAYTVNDSSTAIATIAVNVYKRVEINDSKIYNLYLTGSSSTQVPGGISASTVKTEANKYLKYPVVELININTGVQIPVAYDLNGNGKLDFFKNSRQHELNVVYQALQNNKLRFNDIVRFKDAFTRNWEIMQPVAKGDTFLLVKDPPRSPADKGFDLSKPYGEYALQLPNGTQSEAFQILSTSGDTVFITTSSNKANVKGFSKAHPKTNSLTTSHVVVSKSMTGGLSPYENANYPNKSRPALICGSLNTLSIGQRVAHELMHGQGLRDVNDNTNIMHFNTSLNIGDLPFRYKILTPVVTGTSGIDTTKPKQNQWELIKGR